MSLPRRSRLVAAAALVALAVAACGSATSSAGPSAPAAATASTSPAPSVAASGGASTLPAPSGEASASPAVSGSPLPTFTRDAELEAMLPKTLGDTPLTPTSLSGTDVLASGRDVDVKALETLLKATGGQPSDYAFAYAVVPGPSAVGVFRVKGADPETIRDSLIDQGKTASSGAYVIDAGTVGGKKVTIFRVNQDGTDWSTYYWPKGDVLFYAQTVDPKIAESFFSSL